MKKIVKSTKFVIIWKPIFEVLNPKIWSLRSLTLKSQNCQNWIKNHLKSKFLTVDYLRIRFCIDIIFQIFSKFIRSWLDINYPNLKFWSPYIIKIWSKFTKIGSNHQNFQENSSNPSEKSCNTWGNKTALAQHSVHQNLKRQ